MKFLELQLLRFGHFTDYRLEFEHGAGLHVIFGANEAGKSTTLRAVSGLLFGIPENTADHHLHDMPELRIGARLQNSRGEQLHILRRKGRQNTLLDSSENPLDEHILQRYIGATTRELFATMFGLSHSALIEGGQALLEGRGELGESLFGASLGVRGIHDVRTTLEREAAAIFTARGKNPQLNQALGRFREAKKAVTEHTLRPREWQDQQTQLHTIEQQLQQLQQQHAATTAKLSRLQRLQRTLPNLHQRRRLLEQRQALGDPPQLPENCREQRQRAQETLQRCELQQKKYHDEQQRCRQTRAALNIPEALLTRADTLEELRDMLARQRAAQRDMPGLQEKHTAAAEDIQSILRELGRPLADSDFAATEQLVIDIAAQTRIRQLSQDGIRLQSELHNITQDLAAGEYQQQQIDEQLKQLPPVRDAGGLRHLISEIGRQGDLEARLEQADEDAAVLQQQIERLLNGLKPWQGTPEQAAQLEVPLPETVLRYENFFQRLQNDRQRLQQQQESVRQQLAGVNSRIDALERQGAVPSDSALQQTRTERSRL
jgi:uncharacterized protein YhaN